MPDEMVRLKPQLVPLVIIAKQGNTPLPASAASIRSQFSCFDRGGFHGYEVETHTVEAQQIFIERTKEAYNPLYWVKLVWYTPSNFIAELGFNIPDWLGKILNLFWQIIVIDDCVCKSCNLITAAFPNFGSVHSKTSRILSHTSEAKKEGRALDKNSQPIDVNKVTNKEN
ncbi:MAG: hypothetical protein Q9M45_12770 [Robiginitomaculum sp.]|nr:hypothetical protein [Robiginitomaculum sp.]